MLIVETIGKIRRRYFVDQEPIKQISRELRISRNTVRKVVRSKATAHSYERRRQHKPMLGPYLDELNRLLEEDYNRPKRQRLKATKLFELLKQSGYQGAYDSVRRHVKEWRVEQGSISKQVFIPLKFAPGEAYQFDWSHEQVIIGGVPQKIKVAHFRLCHSRMFFVAAYPRESQEMVFDAHNRAFAFFGGTCRRGIYDNLKTAVSKVLKGKARLFNSKFLQLCSHYLVEPVACTPGSGWEKGQVENQVKNIRNWLFTPRQRFSSFTELNGWLSDQCLKLSQERQHPEDKKRTIWDVFSEEQKSLIKSPVAFDGYTDTECRVSSTSLVRYDRNHYSVDSKLAGKTATVRASADSIKVISNGCVVADHPRHFGRDKVVYDPYHYIEVLKQKPGALRNGAPFQDWQLPPGLKKVRAHLTRQTGGDREFVDLLCVVKRHGLEVVEKACLKAIAEGAIRGEVIVNLIARSLDPAPIKAASVPESLVLTTLPLADCGRYDRLRREVSHGAS